MQTSLQDFPVCYRDPGMSQQRPTRCCPSSEAPKGLGVWSPMAFDGVWVSETLRAWCWLEFRSSSVICLVLIRHLSSVELAFLSVKLIPVPQGMLCRLQLPKYADGNISIDLTHTCAWHTGGHSHPRQHT